MTAAISTSSAIRIAPTYRLQWEEAQQAFVLLYPEGMVKLNPAASEILKRCDGSVTVQEIVDDLKRKFPDADLKTDVLDFLEIARSKGWVHAA